MSSVVWLLATTGVTSIGAKGIVGLGAICGLGVAGAVVKFQIEKGEARQEKIKKDFEKMTSDKKEAEVKLFDKKKYEENLIIQKDYDQMQVNKKSRELEIDKMINTHIQRIDYKGIKSSEYNDMLFGFDVNRSPVFLNETNYCIVAPTRVGKSKKAAALLLNWIGNKQGLCYIADLKRSDYKLLKGKQGVIYINNIEQLKELIEVFKKEFIRRQDLIEDGNYNNMNHYNRENPTKKERSYLLFIDEFPRVSSAYSLPNGKPIPGSVYAEIVNLSMLIGYTNGHIVVTSQRGTVDFLTGGMKANTNFMGMKAIDENNSKVVISTTGCERLRKTESLSIIDGTLTKVFSYNLTDEMFEDFCSKLK